MVKELKGGPHILLEKLVYMLIVQSKNSKDHKIKTNVLSF